MFLMVAATIQVVSTPANFLAGTGYWNLSGLPINSLLPFFQSISYSPENILKSDSVIIPMKRAGRLLLIEAVVDNETGNLVFDTGASGLIFNNTYFRDHLRSATERSNGINGSIGAVEQTIINKIEFAGLTYKRVSVDLANLGHIENRRGVKILGLIGFNLIKDFEIIIDAQNNQLKLYRIDSSGKRISTVKSDFRPDHSQKIWIGGNIIFLEGTIREKKLNFCFDTGAETNVISSYVSKNILNTISITRRAGLSGTGSAGREVLFGKMNDFSIGNQPIRGMETIISNLEPLSEAYGTKIDGILGFNFMEQGILCINFARKQFCIQYTKGEAK
jgi:hypothetical protein